MESAYLVISALIMEFIDSSLGMMYGTALSPRLIFMNYNAKDVVPCILISQAVGGFFGPKWLSTINSKNKLEKILDALVLLEGVWVLYKVWVK
jgi:uncharacterized membrane protein YfcA